MTRRENSARRVVCAYLIDTLTGVQLLCHGVYAAQACLETARMTEDGLMDGRALWQLGRLLAHQGQHSEGKKLKREGMLLMEATLGPDHLDVAKCCTGDRISCRVAAWTG